MLDLNHILLFIACLSPLVMLAQTFRRGGLFRAWRMASFAVLLVTAGAWLVDRDSAGFVGGGAWLALLVVPAIGLRKIAELSSHGRYGAARRWAVGLRFLHPRADLPAQAQLLRALELGQRGAVAEALELLSRLRNNQTNAGRQATAQSFRLRGEWANLIGWVRSEVPPPIRRSDFALMALYLRALGEVGARDEIVLEFATMLSNEGRLGLPLAISQSCRLMVLAFTGRLGAHQNSPPIQKLPFGLREFWSATSEFVFGNPSTARARLEKLQSANPDRLLASEIDQRLAGLDEPGPAPLTPRTVALLHRIEQIDRQPMGLFGTGTMRPTVAVLIFITLNVAMFLAEIWFGGSTNPDTLNLLGELKPQAIRVRGEYWRMLTALFLHYGPLHLIFNLYALFVIGPGLERIIGPVRFALCYLVAGLGSGVAVLLWQRSDVVGASGCVLGIVGVWAGYLLRHRHEPFAGRRLQNILLVVVIQIAFDLSTPQISMSAHLGGLVTGVILGLLVARRQDGGAME